MVYTRQISQVEDVVELGWGWWQLLDHSAVIKEIKDALLHVECSQCLITEWCFNA